VRAVLTEQAIEEGVEIQHHGDLPARSGMGSSSSFTVGLLNSVRAYKGLMSSSEWLAKEAIRIEQEVIREDVGSQDQIWAAYGGTNLITFDRDGEFHVTPIIIARERREELESHLLLVFTGFSRTAALMAKKQIQNLDRHEKQLLEMRELVDESVCLLQDNKRPIKELGLMLHDMWTLKKELADSISNPAVDGIYAAALEAGAVGGKLVGAGGGGFMLLVVEPQCRAHVRERLRSLTEVSFEIGSSGSRIVIYEPDHIERDETYPVSAG
jgi:D-glycero-alpha-D-manno-heptose-7-phosphate kinase